jgi:hypothetical protein
LGAVGFQQRSFEWACAVTEGHMVVEFKETSRLNQGDMSGWIVWVRDQTLYFRGRKIASFATTP